jgi:hypothetical protein
MMVAADGWIDEYVKKTSLELNSQVVMIDILP